MNLLKSSLVFSFAFGMVFTTAYTGVPFEYRVGMELSSHQGITAHMPSLTLHTNIDAFYHHLHGPHLVLAAPVLTPATPYENTSCGIEGVTEEAKLEGTCPIRSVEKISCKHAHVNVHSEGSTKLLLRGSEEMRSFGLNTTCRNVRNHRLFLSKDQQLFGLSDSELFLSKEVAGLVGLMVTWFMAFPESTSDLSSMTRTAASTHVVFIFLLVAYVLALFMILVMHFTALAGKKHNGYLNVRVPEREELAGDDKKGEKGKHMEGATATVGIEQQQFMPTEALLQAQESLAEAKKEGVGGPCDVVTNHFEKECRKVQHAESSSLFEDEGLIGTVIAKLLVAEDEGVEAVPPVFNNVERRKMTLKTWTNFRMMTKGPGGHRLSVARMDMAPSTSISYVTGEGERSRSESVLPRGTTSFSINVDGAVVLTAAHKPKKMGKMAAFRARWKRVFRVPVRKSSFSHRATAATSSCGMA
ncbi:hypothetical protein VYU27_002286 [Nannochloropsis oceanica]